jgi:hypothetical protein
MKSTPYPGYDVLDKWQTPSWNDATRTVMARRLGEVPGRRFFSPAEWAVLVALCERVVPQPDRDSPVPIAPWIDAALAERRGTGTRQEDMPQEEVAWRQGLAALDAEALHREGRRFPDLAAAAQDALIRSVDRGEVESEGWQGLPPQTFLRKLAMKRIVQTYYAHPAAMSEIGYGGPASPRGYVRLKPNRADPWEARFGYWEDT